MTTPQIKNDRDLQRAIVELERQKNADTAALRDQWEHTRKNLNPLTLLKDGVRDLFISSDVRSGALKGLLSLAAGFVTRKLIVGNSGGVARKVVGTLAQTGATTLAYKQSDAIQHKGASILSGLLKKLKIGQ